MFRAVENKSLPQALLFSGPDKIGKRDFAVDFARGLAGESAVNPDLLILEPEKGVIGIKAARDLLNKLSLKPYAATCKVAVIDQAHTLNKEAQNCLLKFLEEPAENTYLILVTAFPFLLLDTVRSRLQKIRFFAKTKDGFTGGDLEKLLKQNLVFRFKYAKESEEKNIAEILDNWTTDLRSALLSKAKGEVRQEWADYSLEKISEMIKNIQKTKYLLFSTNANQRLALEMLFLNL